MAHYIRQVNVVNGGDILWCLILSVSVQSINRLRRGVIAARGVGKSICLITVLTEIVREKLRTFPFGQYIIGNDTFLAFWWRSQVQNRNGGCEEMYKNVNTVSDEFFRTKICQSRHSRRYRWHHYHSQATRLLRKYIGRCLHKRVDVYIITLSCTWRIYALSERLLVK